MCLAGSAFNREGSRGTQTLSFSGKIQPIKASRRIQPILGSGVQPVQGSWILKAFPTSQPVRGSKCWGGVAGPIGVTEHDSMSSIVALCHFCEFHGPSNVMLTQACLDHPAVNLKQFTTAIARTKVPSSPAGFQQNLQVSSDSLRTLRETGVETENPLYKRLEQLAERRKKTEGCDGCWSLAKTEDVIMTNDEANGRSFVSSQSSLTPQLSNLIRHACIRSISCEVSTNREGPVLFSDPSVATVLSHSFFLKDSKARGFKRYYSLILISKERQHLISSWDLVVDSFGKIIQLLQDKADSKYSAEIGEVMENTKLQEKMESGCVVKENYYRRRGSSKPARNLRELTMDLNIFYNLHQKNVRILWELEKNLHESILTGQPMKSCPVETAKIDILLDIIDQIGVSDFKNLAFCLLSGKPIQIKSSSRSISQQVGQSLSALLPTSLQNRTSFANLVFLGQEEIGPGPLLEAANSDNKTVFNFFQSTLQVPDEFRMGFCSRQFDLDTVPSSVTKLSRILTSGRLPLTVKQMSLKTLSEQLVSQARIFSCITNAQDRKKFLTNIGCTRGDEAIFNFFAMYI